MAVKFEGPNNNFVPKMLKKGGDFKPGGEKKTMVESVNHDRYDGSKAKPDTNPGAYENSKMVHGADPAEKDRRPGMKVPEIGGEREIGKEEKLNHPPRAFKYSREGHSVMNGSNSEQEHAMEKDY